MSQLLAKFELLMEPVPQGSMKARSLSDGRATMYHASNAKLRSYRNALAALAQDSGCRPNPGALALTVTFNLPRPKSRPKRDLFPDRKPDIDKLLRAVMDGLTGVAYRDDAQVVEVFMRKQWHPERHVSVAVEVWTVEEPVEQASQATEKAVGT